MDHQNGRASSTPRLGVGPMSRNVVDATIRLAYRHRRAIMIVACRSQIESDRFGGGYVEGWSTEKFVRYVAERDPMGLVMVCRDHGGPWQHPDEHSDDLAEAEAMASGLESLRSDIRSGVGFLHLDTSRDRGGEVEFGIATDRLVTLYAECLETARTLGRELDVEVGLEQQSIDVGDAGDFRAKTEHLMSALASQSLPSPVFMVGQTGTKVVGLTNAGRVTADASAVGNSIAKLAGICSEYGLLLKAHNGDYLSTASIGELVRNGTHAVNIAPEFGVVETRAFLGLIDELVMPAERDEFLALAYDSGGWRKWFIDGHGTDLERCLAAGHYVFATPEFRAIKARVQVACRKRPRTVDAVLGAALDVALDRCARSVWSVESGVASWNG